MRPAPALIAALVACALAGVLTAIGFAPPGLPLAAAALLVAIALPDAFALRRTPSPQIERELPQVVPVGVERPVVLRLRSAVARTLAFDIHDHHPGDWPVFGLPRRVALPAGREIELTYRLTPTERGAFAFGGCDVRLLSPLRLWRQQRRVPLAQSVRVYPNFAPLAKLALVGAERASRVVGAHLKRRRGEGTEFQQLREYRNGDALRQIDWKASQRARKLISRDYQIERNQQVLLLVDTGRRMLARDGNLAHFDHCLNAALMVAYIALRQGDGVGLLAAGGETRYFAPRRGLGTIDALLNSTFDLHATPLATDYLDAAKQLGLRQQRRSLVLLITNMRDEDIDDLLSAVRQLQKRHLVCVASLREQALERPLDQPVANLADAIGVGALAQYIEQRALAHEALRAQGTDVLDVTCAELPAALVQHYLAVKRAARL
ncbi:MAG: lipoprotein [Rhodanobacteraceae bacterium]